MTNAFMFLNYVAVLVVAVIGFLFGWLWYSPLMFARPWIAEMKMTDEMMKASMGKGMGFRLIKGFIFTLVSTLGLALLIMAHGTENAPKGAVFGLIVGGAIVGARMLNSAVWENRSFKLQAITVGHELILFALQGAIFGVWR
jgi:hypothetical protein